MFFDRYNRRRVLSIATTLAGSFALAACDGTSYNNDTTMTAAKLNEKIAQASATAGNVTATEKLPKTREQIKSEAYSKHHTEDPTTHEKLNTTPWLYLPFAKKDATNLKITQGWFPNPEEIAIDKIQGHMAIDISGPFGTLLYAPTDGWYLCTIQEVQRKINNPKTKQQEPLTINREGKDKWIAYGGGLFIEYRAENGRDGGQLLHCSKVINMPFIKPTKNPNGGWNPQGFNESFDDFKKISVYLKAGEQIGAIGVSGLGIETYGKYNGEDTSPVYVSGEIETWDPANLNPPYDGHVHHETYRRMPKTQGGGKYGWQDPTGIYGWAVDYSLVGKKQLGQNPLYLTDSQGKLLFAA